MTQRSILAGKNQTIIIKVGGSVTVKGHDGDLVVAETESKWGLTVERRSESQIGRARAAVGEHVLFDVRLKMRNMGRKSDAEIIEVQMGASGEVLVPYASNLKVYAGKDIDVQSIQGQVDAYAGLSLTLRVSRTVRELTGLSRSLGQHSISTGTCTTGMSGLIPARMVRRSPLSVPTTLSGMVTLPRPTV